jgi:hypothetical protein
MGPYDSGLGRQPPPAWGAPPADGGAALPDDTFSFADDLELQKLQAGMAQAKQAHYDGEIDEDDLQGLLAQIRPRLAPLLAAKSKAQQQQQQQMQEAMHQAAVVQSLKTWNAGHDSQGFRKACRYVKPQDFPGFLRFGLHQPPLRDPASGCSRV